MNENCCSQCKFRYKITIKEKEIFIRCHCGNDRSMSIQEFYDKNKALTKEQDTKIKEGYDHLNYFTTIKNYHTSLLQKQINEIESAYEDCYNRNKNILQLIEILSTNFYDEDSKINRKIYLYQCTEEKNINIVIKYYNTHIINKNKNFNIDELKTFQTTIKDENFTSPSLIDKNTAISPYQNSIYEFDKENNI